MPQFKDEDVQRQADDFKSFLYEITDNLTEEARRIGISGSTMRQYSNPNSDHHFPAFAVHLHSKGREILHWISSRLNDGDDEDGELNGRVDDESLEIIRYLGKMLDILKTSSNRKAVLEALNHCHEIKQQVMLTERELENLLNKRLL